MQRFIIILLCGFAFFASHDVMSEDIKQDRKPVEVDSASSCEDDIKTNRVMFTRPGVIEKMKPFVIQETKNIKKPFIQDNPA